MTLNVDQEYVLGSPDLINFGVPVPSICKLEPMYSPDACLAQTPFTEAVIQGICSVVADLAGTSVKVANVSWSNTEGNADHRWDLVIGVDASWDEIDAWEYAILDEVLKWAKFWTDSQEVVYSQHIFHSLAPAQL
jgi:hypothetical protein